MDLGVLAWVERDNKIQVQVQVQVQVDGDGCSPMVVSGITYPVVAIGTQCWTAENMKHAATTGNAWNYNDSSSDLPYNNDGYGLLYDWVGAMNGSTTEGAQGICALGWHIPSREEFDILKGVILATYPTNPSMSLQVGGGSGFEAPLAGLYSGNYFWPYNAYRSRDTYIVQPE